MPELLASWRDGAAREAITEFVRRTTDEGGLDAVPSAERVAVFDNDGTLWCEKPLGIQLDFILRRLIAMAEATPELRARQPWKAAYEHDRGWFDAIVTAHYAGDDSQIPTLAAGVLGAYAGISVEDFEAQAHAFLTGTQHPTLGRTYVHCAYAPMVELLHYLRSNGFSTYIASGGGRDFLRPICQAVYGIPRENVIGSASTLSYESNEHGGTIRHEAAADYLDDGPEKPIRIWSQTGRRPLLAAGNANGDIPMLHFTQHPDKPSLRLLVLHDDAEREFAYSSEHYARRHAVCADVRLPARCRPGRRRFARSPAVHASRTRAMRALDPRLLRHAASARRFVALAVVIAVGTASPSRTSSRRPGGSSTRCSATPSKSIPTPAAPGVPGRPTACYRKERSGMTRTAERAPINITPGSAVFRRHEGSRAWA